jgi:tRNA threonylcarbamoyladenosine biosynthesis protein TsaE
MRESVHQDVGTIGSAMSTATLLLADAAATLAAGARLAQALRGGMVVTLAGDLGSGKTTLVRGCLDALGWQGSVKSPTYTLVEHYELSSLYFYHFDFYRFTDPDEWETTGFAECFRDDAICVIEWPARVAGRLPVADLALTLAYAEGTGEPGRRLTLAAGTKAGEECLRAIASAADGADT